MKFGGEVSVLTPHASERPRRVKVEIQKLCYIFLKVQFGTFHILSPAEGGLNFEGP